jgi:hypothetical protein
MPRSLFLLFLLILTSFDQPKLVTKKLPNGVSISVPNDWRPMDGLDFTERYPSVRAPIAAFTDGERLVDFSVNISATQWPDANLDMASKFFKSSVMNMFNRVEMIDEGTKEVHGKKFIFFEFESRVSGNRRDEAQTDPVLKYTYLMYYVETGRTLVFSFNCPRRDKEAWQPVAREMMGKVKIKK